MHSLISAFVVHMQQSQVVSEFQINFQFNWVFTLLNFYQLLFSKTIA